MFLSKYGVARHIYIPVIKRAVVDFAVGADWTPAAGDVKISKDGGAAANVTNLPTAITMGNTAMWDFSLTATEMQAAQVVVTVADSATKAVEDTQFDIETYGNASAQHAVDLSDSVRAGLTALPNAAAEAAGGLYTRGTGAGQIRQDANGRIDANAKAWIDGTIPAVNVTGVPKVDVVDWLGSAPNALVSGRVDSSVGAMAAAVLTATAIAADAITAAKVADGTIDRATFAADTGLQAVRSNTAQAGAAGTITLDASASAVDNFYVGQLVYLTGATGAGQIRVITGYVGSTKVATVDRNWATNPDNTTTFALLPVDTAKLNASLEVVAASLTAAPSDSSGITTLLSRLTSGRATNLDNLDAAISSRMATFTLPTNFSLLAIDANGRVDVSKWLGATVNALISGRLDANTQALLAGVITTAAFAANAIDTTVIKGDAKESIADTLLGRNIDGGSNTGRLVKEAIKRLRNRVYIAAGTLHVTEANDTSDSWTAAVTTTAGNPISDVDPA